MFGLMKVKNTRRNFQKLKATSSWKVFFCSTDKNHKDVQLIAREEESHKSSEMRRWNEERLCLKNVSNTEWINKTVADYF